MVEAKAENRSFTRAERAVLDVLLNPKYFKSTNIERIAAAGISERRWYEIMSDPWFKEQHKNTCMDIIRDRIGGVVKSAVDSAVDCAGRDGHQDRKMLLEMSGLYEPKQKTEITGKDGGPVETKQTTDLSVYTSEELKQLRDIDEAANTRRDQQRASAPKS